VRGLAGAEHLHGRVAGRVQVTPQWEAVMSSTVDTATEIRSFHVDIPEEALDDLRRRIAATQWPEQETDMSQGVPLATMQKLARYWATEYDWRIVESTGIAARRSIASLPDPPYVASRTGSTTERRHLRLRDTRAHARKAGRYRRWGLGSVRV